MIKSLLLALMILGATVCHGQQEERVGILPKMLTKKADPDTSIFDLSKGESYGLDKFSLSLGIGFDFAGLGLGVHGHITKKTSLFANISYYIEGSGWNAGIRHRFLTDATWNVQPYLLSTYGTNTFIMVPSDPELDKLFEGFTLGAGFQAKWRKSKVGYMTLGLMFPIESPEATQYLEYLKDEYDFEKDRLLPFRMGISLGYHFVLRGFRS